MVLTYLHPSTSSLTKFQKGAPYFGTKVSDHLPTSIENFSNEEKQFRLALKEVSSSEFISYIGCIFQLEIA